MKYKFKLSLCPNLKVCVIIKRQKKQFLKMSNPNGDNNNIDHRLTQAERRIKDNAESKEKEDLVPKMEKVNQEQLAISKELEAKVEDLRKQKESKK